MVAEWVDDGKAGAEAVGAHLRSQRHHAPSRQPCRAGRRLAVIHVSAHHGPSAAGGTGGVVVSLPCAAALWNRVLQRLQRVAVLSRVAEQRLLACEFACRDALAARSETRF